MTSKGPWDRVGLGPRTRRRQRPRMQLRPLLGLSLAVFLLLWLLLPYDNAVRLAFRWNWKRLQGALRPRPSERWVLAPPAFPVDLREDVAVILKTGYGTRERVPAWFDALGDTSEFRDIVVIADYEAQSERYLEYRDQRLPVHDVVQLSLRHFRDRMSHPRVKKYSELAGAIRSGDEELALRHCRSFGWELDAMKFISGLEFAYQRYSDKKWYLLVDDDTFVIQPSLRPLLEHLDPARPHYLGNAVGDFRARFAHGGSAVILSHAAMSRLFGNSRALSSLYVDSLDETWGDRLLARALLRLGIHLDETYSHLFNGEPPRLSKIRADRLCSPALSFHKLASPAAMREVGGRFGNVSRPVLWNDLWEMHGHVPPWRRTDAPAVRRDWDHVGPLDESTLTIHHVRTAEGCKENCDRRSRGCLAWTWEPTTKSCHISPWMIVGEPSPGHASGVNIPRARHLESNCIRY